MKPEMKRIEHFKDTQYGSDWPNEKLTKAVGWFQKQLNSIPVDFRDSATLDIDTEFDGYSDYKTACIRIIYYRPETIDEYNERVALADKQANLQRERDLMVLAELKAKYGDAQ